MRNKRNIEDQIKTMTNNQLAELLKEFPVGDTTEELEAFQECREAVSVLKVNDSSVYPSID